MNNREWTAEEEVQLFHALEGLKPVGINKHFYMACIAHRLSKSLNRDIPGEHIWAHLRTMYNLEALDELEPLPFPNDVVEFAIPEEYAISHQQHHHHHHHQQQHRRRKRSEDGGGAGPHADGSTAAGNEVNNKGNASHQSTKDKTTPKAEVVPKRSQKRTRNNTSSDQQHSSPRASPTPSPAQPSKRRRI